MGSFLKSGVHAVVVGEDLALIDLDADAYLCLPGGAVGVRTENGAVLQLSGPTEAAIVEAGLTADRGRAPARIPPPLPVKTIIHDTPTRVSFGQIVKGCGAVWDVRRALRSTGLHPILAVAPARDNAAIAGKVADAARAFWRIAPWLPQEGECLVRSALLMSYLRRSGLSADWVFGIRLWPFSAHCWVQIDDVCLNDDVERLAAYTPIYCR
ncbi:lasso peptide biosynthesis B2 protein [Brevundimonas sp.]|uniref:lasso peptide biosynthesis B2 protein n=1 Tax=Brevundimonas sp. TaxID=1871086 RepID=UPI001A272596|nr:lasso peptide biosynthesis B2 protein [Brevundimonas sp.]MBJ7483472.1 lasso peptide biosynthesis B2 protein [Brevundimonas sp.]